MPRDRHGPNKLSRYLEIHHTWMHQLALGDFVLSDGVGVAPYSDGVLLMAGRIQCAGGLYVDVWKLLAVVAGDGTLSGTYVQTVAYSYNAALPGQGRYCQELWNGPHDQAASFRSSSC